MTMFRHCIEITGQSSPNHYKHSATIPGTSVHFSSFVVAALSDLVSVRPDWNRDTQWPTLPFMSSVQLKFYEKPSYAVGADRKHR